MRISELSFADPGSSTRAIASSTRRLTLGTLLSSSIRPSAIDAFRRIDGAPRATFRFLALAPFLPGVCSTFCLRPVSRGSFFTRSPISCPRHAQLIELLEVQPKLRADAKPVAKTQRCVRRDTALAIDDSGDPVYWHVNLPCQLRCRHVEFSQLFGKMLAGVNRGARHGMWYASSSGNQRSRH